MVIGDGFVFIENPKTASTSISHALRSEGGENIFGKHTPLSTVQMLPRFIHVRACVVRNPFTRMISGYIHNTKPLTNKITFKQWIFGDPWKCGPLDFKRTPQMAWTNEATHILRFENLQKDFSQFCADAGLPDIELPHLNISKPRSITMDSECINAIADRFAPDLKTWGYHQPEWE